MAGFFGMANYNKPGKGVEKDEPQKKGVPRFFELFFRKFWNYVKLNLLYIVTCIPAIIYYIFIVSWLLSDVMAGLASEIDIALGMLVVGAAVAMAIVMFGAGSPCVTGYTYILRNYVREDHAWLWSDFVEQTKKNFKQGIVAFLVDVAVMTVFLINLRFYLIMWNQGLIYSVLGVLFAMVVVLYLIMHTYIWTMMVTFTLTLKQIYKNAFIMTVLAMPRNLGGMIVRGAVYGILFYSFINPLIAFILTVTVMISVEGLIGQMFSYPVIKKYLLDRIEETEEEYIEEDEDIYGDDDEVVNYPEVLHENDVASLFKNREEEQ